MVKKGERIPGSGIKRGTKHAKTLEKEQARELVRQMVTDALIPLVRAQLANARGLAHIFLRREDGAFTKARNEAEIEAALNGDPNGYYLFTKDPSIQAFQELLNRALDKPKEQAQEVNLHIESAVLERLDRGRLRNAERKALKSAK